MNGSKHWTKPVARDPEDEHEKTNNTKKREISQTREHHQDSIPGKREAEVTLNLLP